MGVVSYAGASTGALGGAPYGATKRVRGVPGCVAGTHVSAATGAFGGAPYRATKLLRGVGGGEACERGHGGLIGISLSGHEACHITHHPCPTCRVPYSPSPMPHHGACAVHYGHMVHPPCPMLYGAWPNAPGPMPHRLYPMGRGLHILPHGRAPCPMSHEAFPMPHRASPCPIIPRAPRTM